MTETLQTWVNSVRQSVSCELIGDEAQQTLTGRTRANYGRFQENWVMQASWAIGRTTWLVLSLVGGLLTVTSPLLSAAEPTWAEKMFDSQAHDFGVVARAAKVTHRFKITNLYQQVVHIARVRSTCGCSVARPSKTTLATGEVAFFDVTMDTVRFRELKSSVLTVVFDRPLYARGSHSGQGLHSPGRGARPRLG